MVKITKRSVFIIATLLVLLLLILFANQAGKVTVSDLDMSGVEDAQEKKARFFNFMRPVIVAENQKVEQQREQIIKAQQEGDNRFINKMRVEYKLKEGASSADLLKRVDTVPLDLALAQSANESMWGQSRFAQDANNMFGQWCFTKGCGMVPGKRDAGATHEVQTYSSVNASVASYIYNLNTTGAYQQLRDIRAQLRSQGKPVTGMALAPGLLKYSERGQAYVDEIQSMIRVNDALKQTTPRKNISPPKLTAALNSFRWRIFYIFWPTRNTSPYATRMVKC